MIVVPPRYLYASCMSRWSASHQNTHTPTPRLANVCAPSTTRDRVSAGSL